MHDERKVSVISKPSPSMVLCCWLVYLGGVVYGASCVNKFELKIFIFIRNRFNFCNYMFSVHKPTGPQIFIPLCPKLPVLCPWEDLGSCLLS